MRYSYQGKVVPANSWVEVPMEITVAEDKTEVQQIQIRPQDLTAEQRATLGMVEVGDDIVPDGRFYFAVGHPRSLDDCKRVHIDAINTYVASVLAQTDWYHMRALDTDASIPDTVKTFRNKVRSWGNELVGEVQALTTVEEIAAWQQHDWPTS